MISPDVIIFFGRNLEWNRHINHTSLMFIIRHYFILVINQLLSSCLEDLGNLDFDSTDGIDFLTNASGCLAMLGGVT